MTFAQFLLILRARYRLALTVALLTLAAAYAASAWLPRNYSAQTSLLVDLRAADPMTAAQGITGVIAPSFMATQVDIIGGERVAQRVVAMLGLAEDPVWAAQWQQEAQGQGQLADWIAGALRRNLDVRPARESNVIHISYKSAQPQQAADIANAFSQAYLETVLALRTEPAKVYSQWFDDQVRSSRARLEEAQARFSAFAQRAGLVSTDERIDHESTRLSELSSQLATVQGQNTDAQSKRADRGETVVDVMQSAVVNALRADVSRMEARVREAGVNLGPNHPQMLRLQSELAALRSQLQVETARVTTSIDTSFGVGRERERQLQGVLATQKARVMAMNKQRDELNVFRRDLEAAQRAYDDVSKSASQTRLQSLSNQTNVTRLDSAARPQRPTGPSRSLVLLVAAFVAGLLGVGLALFAELVHRRVRSLDDMAQVLDVPVLGSVGGSRFSSHRSKGTLLAGPAPLALGHGRLA